MSDLHLYVYDLSKGMARQFSAMFLGRHFDGVWHTGVAAFGKEWFFGNDGIDCCPPKGTILGDPNEIIHLGKTELDENEFLEIIRQLSETSYKIGTYNLLEHNCNNFSNDLAQILVGKAIPAHIVDLPREILSTPLGPMLRPLLEQAADPIHQYRSGNNPSNFARQLASNLPAQNKPATKQPVTKPIDRIPSTVTIFKSDTSNEFDSFLAHFQTKNNLNDYNLLVEVKEFLQQKEKKWSIGKNHVRVLFDAYVLHAEQIPHKISILKLFQEISLETSAAELISVESRLHTEIVDKFKITNHLEIQHNVLQMMSNLCTHAAISESLLKTHQDKLFKELSEFILIVAENNLETNVHEASVSFFYNLISAFHFDSHLNDSNAFTLGCALLERLPKMRPKPKTIYHMLSLLRSCLSSSSNVRELALSMDFDLGKYSLSQNEKDSIGSATASASDSNSNQASSKQNDSYENILHNIDDILKK